MNQCAELLSAQIYLATFTYRPSESSLLQSFCTYPQTIAVPVKHLDPIATAIGEHKQVPGQWITLELLNNQTVKPVEATA
jgi:hypothetical protein